MSVALGRPVTVSSIERVGGDFGFSADAVVDHYVTEIIPMLRPEVGASGIRRWLTGAMLHEFVSRTAGVVRWNAQTPRGLQILDRWIARTPRVVAAWHRLDPAGINRLLA